MRRVNGAISIVTAAILALVSPVRAAGGPQLLPFGASLEGEAHPQQTTDPCVWTNEESGRGRAIHMGAITWATAETVNFCSNPAGIDVHGDFLFVAADGAEVHGRYTTLAHADMATGTITFSGQWQILGGTGRFAEAGGTGTLTGQGSLAGPGVIASFVGSMTF